jgi:TonB family protein
VATRTGTVLGTPHYMTPEQALGNRLDHRCDVYSLGIVAYEMLFGRTPFTGDSPVAVVLKHVNEPLPVPAASRLPDALLSAIQKAAAKDPLERWPSAGAFVEALEAGLGVARISSTVIGRSADERAEQHSESRPGRLTIAAAAVLGTAALAWVLVMPPRESPGASPGADVKPTSVTTTEEPPPGGGEIPEPDSPATPPGVKEPNPPSPKTPPPPKEREADTTAESSPPNDSSAPEDTVSTLEAGNEVSSPSPEQQSNIQENKTPDADAPAERRGPVALPVPPVDPPPAADVIVLPSCIPVAPDYPGVARAAQLQGIVVLDVTVGADGTVRNVVVVKSPHSVLEDAARKAVMRYTCSPGRRNDVPEAMRIQQTVEFELR